MNNTILLRNDTFIYQEECAYEKENDGDPYVDILSGNITDRRWEGQYVYDFSTDKVAFKDVGLKKGKTYYYKVAAFRNDNGKKKYGDKSKAVGIKL